MLFRQELILVGSKGKILTGLPQDNFWVPLALQG